MQEIVFSIFEPGQEARANLETQLKQFEQEKHIRVKLEINSWLVGWSRLLEIALHGSGPDLSEIGNTWVKDLVDMNALRRFSPQEIDRILDGRKYFDAAWSGAKTAERDGSATTWSIPFISDARMVYYRRDLLAQAGIDESTAFQSISSFENTLKTLADSGKTTALALPTQRTSLSLQNLVCWIWGAGGDFFSPDGTKLALDSDKALDGIKAYFRLGRYLGNHRLDQVESEQLFPSGQAAVVMSGYWILIDLPNQVVRENLGVASVLGTSYVGAEHLVIWQHTRHPEAALELIRFLTRTETGRFLFPYWGLAPYREGWEHPPLNEPQYGAHIQALQNGRGYPDSRLWALVEKRLSEIIPHIWEAVLASPQESDEIVEREITALAKRLRITLES